MKTAPGRIRDGSSKAALRRFGRRQANGPSGRAPRRLDDWVGDLQSLGPLVEAPVNERLTPRISAGRIEAHPFQVAFDLGTTVGAALFTNAVLRPRNRQRLAQQSAAWSLVDGRRIEKQLTPGQGPDDAVRREAPARLKKHDRASSLVTEDAVGVDGAAPDCVEPGLDSVDNVGSRIALLNHSPRIGHDPRLLETDL